VPLKHHTYGISVSLFLQREVGIILKLSIVHPHITHEKTEIKNIEYFIYIILSFSFLMAFFNAPNALDEHSLVEY